ncbi:branched-chain amino acid ABC transporter permease [Microvirga antarctica]|uniref:branched-chain amino acid ABC transporter permease n=1 Tax=Microvirga antarctica TaxID=2819233 RepID=UPI001B3108B1|nr:branched-chain amino acid ABC transporter permease [Microvirga antarctica]
MTFSDVADWFQIYNHSFATALINAVMALSLYFSLRAGIFNLSAVGFMALGAYTAGIFAVKLGTISIVGITVGVLVSLAVGSILVFPILRLRGHYLAIATLSFGGIVQALALNLDSLTNGPAGLIGVPVTVKVWHLLIIVSVLVYVAWVLTTSRTGRAWDAIRTDLSAARAMGINVEHYRLVSFLISTATAALAGGLWAHVNRVIVPFEFGFPQLTFVLVNTLLGGISHPVGPVLGALLVSTMPEWLDKFEQYREMIIGFLLVVIVIYLPNGLIAPFATMRGRKFSFFKPTQAKPSEGES